MSRAEIYPWSMLEAVGDYFVVPEDFKPFQYISRIVSQQMYKNGKTYRYSCTKTTYGSIVMLVQVGEDLPAYEYATDDGVLVCRMGVAKTIQPEFGDRPKVKHMSQEEKIARMSHAMRQANLPWWTDPKTDQPVLNTKLLLPADIEKYVRNRERIPGNNIPYPADYQLDQNLIRYTEAALSELDDEEEEDFGEPPIINEGNGDATDD